MDTVALGAIRAHSHAEKKEGGEVHVAENLALIEAAIAAVRGSVTDVFDWRRNFGVVNLFHEALAHLPCEERSSLLVAFALDHARLPDDVRLWCERMLGRHI